MGCPPWGWPLPGPGQDGPHCKQGSSWDKFSSLGLQPQRGGTLCQGIVGRRQRKKLNKQTQLVLFFFFVPVLLFQPDNCPAD